MSVGLSRFHTPEPDTFYLKEKVSRPPSSGPLEVGRNGLWRGPAGCLCPHLLPSGLHLAAGL